MLVELSVMEQRCHLVMEVVSEAPVTEVACRYGVSRQAVHLWLGKYRRAGPPGMADHSRRPHFHPRQPRQRGSRTDGTRSVWLR
jgi:transposase